MRRHWQYFRYVIRHKWFVFVAGLSLRVPLLQLVFHDWHKFMLREWFPYARAFYAPDGSKQYALGDDFTVAWNHHQKQGKHHWQYWLITWDHGGTEAIAMPDRYRREMLADWVGAGRAITGKNNTWEWYDANKDKIILHPDTREWVEAELAKMQERERVRGMLNL